MRPRYRRLFCCSCFMLLSASLVFFDLSPVLFAQDDSGFKFLEVKVVGPDGKPLADVEVGVDMGNMQFPMLTNEKGMVSLNVPSDDGGLGLKIRHADFAVESKRLDAKTLPEEFTFKLEKGVPIGGLVHDELGQPIEGVKIITATTHVSPANIATMRTDHLATTDDKGRWKVQVKETRSQKMLLQLTHDDYLSHTSYKQRATWGQLKQLDHVLTLEKGIELRGRVTDPVGEPIAGAAISLGDDRYRTNKRATETDEEGNYRFGNVAAGNTIMTIVAASRSPELRTVQTSKNMEPVDFQLTKGQSITILVTDPDGVPISNVGVTADDWRGHRSLPEILYRGKTNEDGLWRSDSMPADEVQFDMYKRGHMSSRDNKLTADGEQHTVVMPWPLVVSGKVVDGESGLPLKKFNVVQGIEWGNRNQQISWQRYNVKPQGQNGNYQLEFTEPYPGHAVRIEAAGYRPSISRVIRSDEGDVTIDFELEAGQGPNGVVKTPDGKPAAEAKLYVATRDEGLYSSGGTIENNRNGISTTADEQGKFTLPFLEEKFLLVCVHATGWAQLSEKQVDEQAENATEIQLQAWSQVEGTLQQGKAPLANESIALYFNQPYVPNAPRVNWSYWTTSDADGKFRFDRVAGSEAIVARSIAIGQDNHRMSTYSHSDQVLLVAGQTAKVQLGGTGRSVQGQLKIPDDYQQSVAWDMCLLQIYERPAQVVGVQGFFHALGKALAQTGNRPQQPKKQPHRRSYAAAVNAEGSFVITDVLPGNYQLNINLYPQPTGQQYNWTPIGLLHQQITIPESEGKNDQDPFDLGEFTLNAAKPTPTISVDAVLPAPVSTK